MSDKTTWRWIISFEGSDWMPAMHYEDDLYRDPIDQGLVEPFEVGPVIEPPSDWPRGAPMLRRPHPACFNHPQSSDDSGAKST